GKLVCPSAGDHSSMVESQIVILVVAGSNPVGHPTSINLHSTSAVALILCDAVEMFFSANEQFVSHDCNGSVGAIRESVFRDDFEFVALLDDDAFTFATENVNVVFSGDRRSVGVEHAGKTFGI